MCIFYHCWGLQWIGIDLVTSLGLSSFSDDLKISRALRPMRKAVSKATGLHGFMSGKQYISNEQSLGSENRTSTVISIDEELGIHDANAVEAEMLARRVASRRRHRRQGGSNNRQGRRWGFRRGQQGPNNNLVSSNYVVVPALDTSPNALEHRRRKRAEEIDLLLKRGSERLLELQCERDDLLSAPNPLFNYTKKYFSQTECNIYLAIDDILSKYFKSLNFSNQKNPNKTNHCIFVIFCVLLVEFYFGGCSHSVFILFCMFFICLF